MEHRPLRVAIVDDDDSVRRALRRLLESSDMETESFASGAELLSKRDWTLVDCIVVDLHMPRMTGLEVIERLAEIEQRVPTIIVTAQDEPDTRLACLAAGASAILVKPIDESTLIDAITRAVERRTH